MKERKKNSSTLPILKMKESARKILRKRLIYRADDISFLRKFSKDSYFPTPKDLYRFLYIYAFVMNRLHQRIRATFFTIDDISIFPPDEDERN